MQLMACLVLVRGITQAIGLSYNGPSHAFRCWSSIGSGSMASLGDDIELIYGRDGYE